MKQLNWMKVRQTVVASVSLATLTFGGTASATTYWVATDGDDNAAGDAEHPVKTIAKGIGKATSEGDEVVVLPGTYSSTRVGFKANCVTLRSSTFDPKDVTLSNAAAHIYDTSHTGIKILGITFRNGRANSPDTGTSICLSADPSYAVISNCVFRDCLNATSAAKGGAVCVYGHAEISDCVFAANAIGRRGGALCACGTTGYASVEDGMVYLTRCSFTGNCQTNSTNDAGGGALYLDADKSVRYGFILKDCGFTNNYAKGPGGAIWGKVMSAENCTFVNNETRSSGGAVYSGLQQNSSVVGVFANCVFSGNIAASYGGGVQANGGSGAKFVRCTFADNTAGDGSAVGSNIGSTYRCQELALSGCAVTGNRCTLRSPKDSSNNTYPSSTVRLMSANAVVTNCVFEGNTSAGGGCGVLFPITSGNKASYVFDSVFRHNVTDPLADGQTPINVGGIYSGDYGGVLTASPDASNTVVRGCLFVGNTNFQSRGIVCLLSKYATYDNCTVADNGSIHKATGYGLYAKEGALVRNCVLAGNGCATNVAMDHAEVNVSSAAGYRNSLVQTTTLNINGKNGNVTGVAPKFVGDGKTPYALKKSSPACGLGAALDWMNAETTDLIGHARLRGDLVDAGCYSYFPAVGLMLILR